MKENWGKDENSESEQLSNVSDLTVQADFHGGKLKGGKREKNKQCNGVEGEKKTRFIVFLLNLDEWKLRNEHLEEGLFGCW